MLATKTLVIVVKDKKLDLLGLIAMYDAGYCEENCKGNRRAFVGRIVPNAPFL